MFSYLFSPHDKDGQPYTFSLAENAGTNSTWREAHQWCTEQFGPRPPLVHGSRWWSVPGTIFFANETDACAFRVRWC